MMICVFFLVGVRISLCNQLAKIAQFSRLTKKFVFMCINVCVCLCER